MKISELVGLKFGQLYDTMEEVVDLSGGREFYIPVGGGLSRGDLARVWTALVEDPNRDTTTLILRDDALDQSEETEEQPKPAPTMVMQTTAITGDVCSQRDIVVLGSVEGVVRSDGWLRVTGTVVGDLYAQCVVLDGAQVLGNIHASQVAILSRDAVLIGDTYSPSIVAGGRVRGALVAEEHVVLKADCYVEGDISCTDFVMEEGASLEGQIVLISDPNKKREVTFPEILL